MALARVAWSDGVMMDEISPRALSRGGTNQGFADNGCVIFDNPGAMVNINGCDMIDIGADGLLVSGWYSDPQNRLDTGTTFTPLPQIAMIRKSADGDWAYGLGVFTPAGFADRFHAIGPDGAPHVYNSFGALLKILPAVSYRLTDRLSVGATLGVGVCYAQLNGPYFLQGPTLPGPLTILHTHNEGADLVWSTGLQYQLTDNTVFGATYQSASPFSLQGNTSVDVLAPPLGSVRYDSTLHMEWPQSVALGIRHDLCPHRRVGVDVIWYDWQRAFDSFTLDLHNPNNGAFPPQITDRLPLNWRDSVSLHVGYEQDLSSGMTFRMGYIFNPNPIPDSTLTPYIQAFMEQGATVGVGCKCYGWDVDLGYVHEWGPTQHVGTSALVGGDFSNSDQRAAVDAILLGFIKTY
ncbi:MAG TPA: outer membrane protein transport protein [Pirellulales bacterium]|jgi:long-chain fatty acid transport protein